MTKTKPGRVLAALSLAAGLAVAADPPAAPRPVLAVTVATPELREIPLSSTAYGSLAAWQEAVIGAEIGGLRLAEVRAQVGEVVRKGQVLAVFADESVLADVAQSRAAVAEAEANLAEARNKAGHARQVADSGAMSELQIVQYETGAKTALARLQSAKAQLDAQLLRQRHVKVLASDDGVVSARNATLGAVASQGQELFRLIRQSRLEWRAEVATAELAQIKPGLDVNVAVPGFAGVGGKVRMVAPTVDAQSRNALVYVDLPEATQRGLRPGMFARGEFRRGASPGLTVPQDALSLRDGFSYVFRLGGQVGDQARVAQVKVQPGRRVGDWVEIVSGLSPGDRLVANGAAFLAEGDSVKVVQK